MAVRWRGLKLKVPLGSQLFELELTVERVDEVIPHEEVIPEHLEKLRAAFAVSLYQRNPVIVDFRSGCVLDGTHRWAAMKALGFKWITVCRVDYFNPLVELDSWARVYRVEGAFKVEEFLSGVELEPIDFEGRSERDLLVVSQETYRVPYRSVWEAFTKLKVIDERFSNQLQVKPLYVARSGVGKVSVHEVAVLPPKLQKEEVVELSKKRLLLPPKSTRHVVPARPMGVNVPLKLLSGEKGNTDLVEEFLRQKRPLLVKPPIFLDREYKEAILYFM
jgi:hypothetical protein